RERTELALRSQRYAADMVLAQAELQNGHARRVLDLLESHLPEPGQPDVRGFDWFYLWSQLHSETGLLEPPIGPTDIWNFPSLGSPPSPYGVAYAPVGTYAGVLLTTLGYGGSNDITY